MSNIRGLSDIAGDGDNNDNDKFNDYYAGGEKSGQLIRGAPDDDDDDDESDEEDRVGSIFNRARQHGAVQGSGHPPEPRPPTFAGVGRTLAGGPAQPSAPQPVSHTIVFYQNDIFTIDDGEPRNVYDPANASFIESIKRGECPEELDPGSSNQPININLVRKEEKYQPPEKPKYVAFEGTGRTLGGSQPSTSSNPPAPVVAGSREVWKGVDEGQPTTSLQLRLSDGSRMVARFNHTHTVADIRRFISASRPDMQAPYTLKTAFPPKVLDDESVSLEQAGLLNAVVIQS